MAGVWKDRIYIGGSWVTPRGSETLAVINPATEECIAEVPESSVEDVRSAIDAARVAFDEGPWPTMTVRERSNVLRRMGEALQRRTSELVALNVAETGSTQMLAEYLQVTVPINHLLDLADRVLPGYAFEQPVLPALGFGMGQGVVLRQPIGVAALISAYNFPLFINLFKLGPALAAGCTAVLKPSQFTPLEALVLGEIADEAGLPAGVLNIVTGGIDAGTELTTNPKVDLVSFTGSDTVGRQIYGQGAATMKKVILELGGKSANIVCDDADLDRVVADVVIGCTVHCGQGCALPTRTLVHESLHDELVDRVKIALGQVKIGDPADETVTMGPLIREEQRERVERLIRTGLDEGAKLAYGGGRPEGLNKGFFLEPTLFVGVDNSMTIARSEFFGPVGVVIPFRTDAEAVSLANDSDFGLAGGVWSANPARAYGIARRMRTGTVTINGGGGDPNPDTPSGGWKQSGLGRERGAAGLAEFLHDKSVVWSAGR